MSLEKPIVAAPSIGKHLGLLLPSNPAKTRPQNGTPLLAGEPSVLTGARSCAKSPIELRPPQLGGLDGWSSGFGGWEACTNILALVELDGLHAIQVR